MMNVLFLAVLVWGLCYASSEKSIEHLMDHVMVLKVPQKIRPADHVPLVCGNSDQSQDVFWKKDGVALKPALRGNQVTVVVDEVDGGNYSCHSADGQYLNHTVVFVQVQTEKVILKEMSPEEGFIQCSAPNYTGPFYCSWSRAATRSNAAVFLLKAARNGQEIPCEVDADGSGIRCLEDSCPYKEEQHHISLTTHIRSFYRLETYTKTFYMSDIVRPGTLPNLRKNDSNVFSWSYPDSWEKPCSFYGLNFQIKVIRHNHSCDSGEAPILVNNTDDTKFEVNVKTKKYVFCVRAQDKYTGGPYSPWSDCKVNKEDISCQPLSLGQKK